MDRNLDAFLATARSGTLTEAANILGLTQPTLTKRISSFEAQLGLQLFERNRRGAALTEAGKVFMRRAERIEAEYRQGEEEIKAVSGSGFSSLRVGAGPLFHLTCVAGLFEYLREEFPDLKLELVTQTFYDSGRMLLECEIDAYLGIIPPEQLDDSIRFKKLTTVEHGVILRADNPIAQQQSVDPSDLSSYSWVSFSTDPITEKAFVQYTVPEGSNDSLVDIRTTSFATGLQLVQSGKFIMSAPLQLARVVENAGLVIRPSRSGMPRRNAGLHLRESAMNFGAIKSLLRFFDKLDQDYFDTYYTNSENIT